ncbi:polysaccharide biosynthesis tyrosine autokinase [Falsigemmobacter intermedius]|uniref:polysaccharide biosynthesis tyrosine autokinase n=1 Tax=Falsigemmobacter intermedius TaxID=1553448 RepID=UPI003F01E947
MSGSQKPEKDDSEIDLLALVMVLWRARLLLAISLVAGILLGGFVILRATPLYEANSLLQLEERASNLALPSAMQEMLGGGGTAAALIETETEILRSRMVLGDAVRELGLVISAEPQPFPILGKLPARLGLSGEGWFKAYEHGNEGIIIAAMSAPEELSTEKFVLTNLGSGAYSLALHDGRELQGRVGEELKDAQSGLMLKVGDLIGPQGRRFILQHSSVAAAVRDIQERLTIGGAGRNAKLLRVSYRDVSPRQAEAVLAAITRSYVGQNIGRSAAEADNSLKFIEEQLPIAQSAVTEAQQEMNAYQQSQQSVDVTYETRGLLDKAADIEGKLNELALQEEDLKKRFTVNHPTYQQLLDARRTLQGQLNEIREVTATLPETQKEIFNLSRNLEVAAEVYTQLLNRAQELRVVRASTVGSVRVIDDAYATNLQVSPKVQQTIAIAAVLGLIIGIGIAFLRHFLRQGIRGGEDIEALGLPVFGTITYSEGVAGHRSRRGNLPIHAIESPQDLTIEAMRSLRTSLHFGMLDHSSKMLLVTSTAPGAGKSFTSINLAVIAAEAGQRVVVVDADMRRGYLRRYINQPKNGLGLAEYLSGQASLEQILLPGPTPNMSVICSGRYPPNPSELLMRAEFERMIEALNKEFDLVIVDSPPVLAVTDPVIMARYAGATILVVRHMETVRGEVEAALRAFEIGGSKITGAVLNGYKQSEVSSYGGGQYYYYNYRYSYKSDADN